MSTVTFGLISPPGCSGLCSASVYLFIIFLSISVGPIISISTGPIFTKFAGLVELWLYMRDMELVFDPARDVAVASNFVGLIYITATYYRLLCTAVV